MSHLSTATRADIATLMAAIACMADRMALSAQKMGGSGDDWLRHTVAVSRRRRAMHRLMDALTRAQGDNPILWGLPYMQMVQRDHSRTATKGA